jgi:hypothetical protein
MLRWRQGPQRKGCVYHQQGIDRHRDDDLVIDIFVMPSIVKRRPVAITIGLYRNFKPVKKIQWQVRRPSEIGPAHGVLVGLLEQLGLPSPTATAHASSVERFVEGAAASIEAALADATKGAA